MRWPGFFVLEGSGLVLRGRDRSDDPSGSNEPPANNVLSCMQETEMRPVTS